MAAAAASYPAHVCIPIPFRHVVHSSPLWTRCLQTSSKNNTRPRRATNSINLRRWYVPASSFMLLKNNSQSPGPDMKIEEVRELLGDLLKEMPNFLSDGTIRRFLRAKNWSTEQATKALKEAVKWRRQFKPDKICWEDLASKENEVQRAYMADYLDNKGRTVFVIKTSKKSLTSTKEHIKQLVYNLEMLALSSEDAQEENVVWMFDFSGWTLSTTPLWETRESLHIIQNFYPGLIGAAILSNPPKIFESFWKIVKHFIEPTLYEKVKFVYSNNSDSQRILADMFDLDKLELAFGGRNTTSLDITKYSERMRRRDQIRGAWKDASGTISPSGQRIQ